MRDIAIALTVFGLLPFIFKRPWLGVLVWVWLGVMNPHKLSYGFAVGFPFAQIVAVVTLMSLVVSAQRCRIVWAAPSIFLLLFVMWMSVTTVFALVPDKIFTAWTNVMKIMLMVFVALAVMHERKHIEWLVWMLVLCLGFYGVKGGIFTITGGGENRVYGPPGTFIEENNTLAVAILMTIPLIWYIRAYAPKPWMRWALMGAAVLCVAAALGSYSRGALVTVVPMLGFLWLKSRQKFMLALLMLIFAPVLVGVMPERWFNRMETISSYEEDTSSMGRINAWETAFNIAKDRPLVGGGFEIYDPQVFARYSPNPEDIHAAHSIYFAALGEHGWIGLFFFLLCGLSAWRTGSWIARKGKDLPEFKREADLALMIQVSLLGYAVGGAFLSLLYFDVPYYLVAVLVLLKAHIETIEKSRAAPISGKYGSFVKSPPVVEPVPAPLKPGPPHSR
jgi:putative inorganic carbon (hco3(-)) transporter